ncbi:hypothetical protein TNIN_34231 [Trichonephila inaurata madagascariensis]|uniref:Uncharacterized protein n=1 Tax=Trichonephila inaurata madagascariensis TaxID=2747483 RepID=A0A8X7CPU9_9ARAC|nr:hypothetical protein TNIN_34231 [Trichonephila inaurata madagascariensis]
MGKVLKGVFVPSQPHSGPFSPKKVGSCACSEPGYILKNFLLKKRNALSSLAVMPMEKGGSLGRKTVKSKE